MWIGNRCDRVLIFIPGGLEHGGGIGRQMGYFLQAREKHKGIEYSVVDSRGPWFLGGFSQLYRVIAGVYLTCAIFRLFWVRMSAGACLLHINITGRGSTVRKLVLVSFAQRLGFPFLLHIHDYDYAEDFLRRSRWMQERVTKMFRAAEKIVVLGRRDPQRLANVLKLAPESITVLHNAVPDPGPACYKQTNSTCELLFLGHLSARKGVPELLQALASPPLASRRWKLTLAGGGPIAEFRTLAAELGLYDKVEFLGWVDEGRVKSLFAKADILVLPSHAEGLAMAVLEGLSHGTVIVTTPVGAHTEVIEPDISGILVPPGDVEALAEALVRLIDDESLRARLGAGARLQFLKKFEMSNYAERLVKLHLDLWPQRNKQSCKIGKEKIL